MSARQPPNLRLDCIVFGLQRVGGISNCWIKLIEHAMSSPRLNTRLLMPMRVLGTGLPAACNGGRATSRESAPARFTRYVGRRIPKLQRVCTLGSNCHHGSSKGSNYQTAWRPTLGSWFNLLDFLPLR